jgi:hypothetical protein
MIEFSIDFCSLARIDEHRHLLQLADQSAIGFLPDIQGQVKLQTLTVSDFDVCKSFLQRGYLPEVFPPIFTSKAWSENIDFKKLVIDAPKDMELNKISYSCTKRGYGRRYFDFVHPASAVATSAWMSRHWKEIQAFCNKTDTAPRWPCSMMTRIEL